MTSPAAEAARLDFLTLLDRMPPEAQRGAVLAEIAATAAETHSGKDSGFALHLYGINAVGSSLQDAIRHWRGMARTMAGGWQLASDDKSLHAAQIEWAAWVLQRQACKCQVNRDHLAGACRIVQQISGNATLRSAAQDLARAQNLFPRPRLTG